MIKNLSKRIKPKCIPFGFFSQKIWASKVNVEANVDHVNRSEQKRGANDRHCENQCNLERA